MKLAGTYKAIFDRRTADHTELSLMRDEIIPMFKLLEVDPPEDLDDLEWTLMRCMQMVYPDPPIRQVLDALLEKGYDIYILSNSIFSLEGNMRWLRYHKIDHYFKKVYVSSEYGVRKPNQKFFDIALTEILAEHPGLKRSDITFVGDSLREDAAGGVAAGLNTVWLNRRDWPNTLGGEVKELKDKHELWEVVK